MKEKVKIEPAFKRKIIGLAIVNILIILFMFHNAFLYKDTIAKVLQVENVFSHEDYGPNNEIERYYDQNITAKILNGTRKNEKIELTNTYSDSGVNDEKYQRGDQLFISIGKSSKNGAIIEKKRDAYLITIFVIFLSLLFLFNQKHGGVIAFSLFINITIFVFTLWQYDKGKNLIILSIGMVLIFTILTLVFAGGWNKKTLVAIISTYITTFLCYGIYEIVLHSCERLPYEMMDYVINPYDLSDLFLAGVLMGSLGAVMDVSISISTGVYEILNKTPDMDKKTLIHSIREIGYDIMGTMINVLLFTYISGALPVIIVKIKNGYTLYHLIHFQMVFEIIRFLMGAIGIVLAIPVAGACSVFLLSNRKYIKKEDIK